MLESSLLDEMCLKLSHLCKTSCLYVAALTIIISSAINPVRSHIVQTKQHKNQVNRTKRRKKTNTNQRRKNSQTQQQYKHTTLTLEMTSLVTSPV